jgi:hypothetical protein
LKSHFWPSQRLGVGKYISCRQLSCMQVVPLLVHECGNLVQEGGSIK